MSKNVILLRKKNHIPYLTHDLLEEPKLDLNTYYQLTRLNFICQLVLNLKLHNLRLFSVSNCPRAYVVLFLLKVYLPGM